MVKIQDFQDALNYKWIVIGSGNGACAFLSQYLALTAHSKDRILVLEEGDNFFETSDITHQRNWTQSYAEGNIFKLHNAQTPDQIPILSGRACTMGGGGSINYTMIFESTEWLIQNFGRDECYWKKCKHELARKFQRENPKNTLTDVGNHVLQHLIDFGFSINSQTQGNIPVYKDGHDKQIQIFPNQFNEFGQRVHSGISLLEWYNNERLDFMTGCRVTQLQLTATDDGQQRCCGIVYQNLDTKLKIKVPLVKNTKVLLCAGAFTPQLLYEHREALNNLEIGEGVNDHIVLPFGIYLLPQDLEPTLKDQYVSLFATIETSFKQELEDVSTVCNFDFFSGSLDTLLYLISHLFLAFWVPNGIKSLMIRRPSVFQWLKRFSRGLVQSLNRLDDVLYSVLHPNQMGKHEWNLISAIVKFNISCQGYYKPEEQTSNTRCSSLYKIILRCFESDSEHQNLDVEIAKKAISDQIPLMSALGEKPHPFFQFLIRLLTRMPYEKEQVESYINHYRRYDLLTEQHLSGGCIFGKAIDSGKESPQDTGKVKGSQNIYVADLSASPLPRVSPQMTAYLIGHHVATQISS